LVEEVQEAVGDEQHEHGKQRHERRVHREVCAVVGAFEVPCLLSTGGCRLLAQELDVRALLRGEQLRETLEVRLAGLARADLVLDLRDPIGLEPFWRWYDALSVPGQMQTIAPLLNKLRAFLLRRPVRAIIGQHRTTLDIPRCLDQGRLLLARLPKGRLGEDTSSLLGSLLVARVWQAATARAAQPPHERRDCSLLIDEVQNFLNLPMRLADTLAEARKYRLSLGLAHQYLGQLRPELRDGLTNARTKIYFQLSPDDATAVRAEVRPELDDYDLERLPAHTAAIRLCQDATTTSAFTLTTRPLGDGSAERRRSTGGLTTPHRHRARHGRGPAR
jgi:hypothetical protein